MKRSAINMMLVAVAIVIAVFALTKPGMLQMGGAVRCGGVCRRRCRSAFGTSPVDERLCRQTWKSFCTKRNRRQCKKDGNSSSGFKPAFLDAMSPKTTEVMKVPFAIFRDQSLSYRRSDLMDKEHFDRAVSAANWEVFGSNHAEYAQVVFQVVDSRFVGTTQITIRDMSKIKFNTALVKHIRELSKNYAI